MVDEKEIIAECCKGNRAFQKQLYDQYAPQMLVVCMRYTNSKEDAEDILQESFIKVFKSIKNFRKESKLAYWIKRIVINTALNHYRKQKNLYANIDINEVRNVGELSLEIENMHYEELLNLIQQLPDRCRVVFNLFAIEGYTHKEIAEQLEITEGTSKSQYSRARSLLQHKLEQIRKLEAFRHG